jgi:hypothetical protein
MAPYNEVTQTPYKGGNIERLFAARVVPVADFSVARDRMAGR